MSQDYATGMWPKRAKHILFRPSSVSPEGRFSVFSGNQPSPSFTTECTETGFAGHGRRLERVERWGRWRSGISTTIPSRYGETVARERDPPGGTCQVRLDATRRGRRGYNAYNPAYRSHSVTYGRNKLRPSRAAAHPCRPFSDTTRHLSLRSHPITHGRNKLRPSRRPSHAPPVFTTDNTDTSFARHGSAQIWEEPISVYLCLASVPSVVKTEGEIGHGTHRTAYGRHRMCWGCRGRGADATSASLPFRTPAHVHPGQGKPPKAFKAAKRRLKGRRPV